MSIAIGNYTDTDKIRGALGFTVSDVPDQYIQDRGISDELLISLYAWLPDHKTRYDAWTAGGADSDNHYKRLLEKYCTYMCAFHLSSGLELLAVQAIGDSKATAERFSSVKLDVIRKRIEGIAAGVMSDLVAELSLSTSATSATIFSSASPDYDPVVGS